MIIYPDIELQGGQCVNLFRGHRDKPVVYDMSPLDAAMDCAAQGAEWLHVVDLDAVFGDGDNHDLVAELIRRAGAPVQVAGGIRTIDTVRNWIEAGAGRVVIATAAVKDPHFVNAATTAYPGQVVISIDARDGKVVSDGWRETTIFSPVEFAKQFQALPLAAIIFTDIDCYDEAPESSLAQTTELAAQVPTPVIASGVVRGLDDISRLRYLPNISGAITGRALFGGAFTLSDAIHVATETAAPTAQPM